MHETCNVRERPFITDRSLHSLDRFAPADPLFDATTLEEPRPHGRPRRKSARPLTGSDRGTDGIPVVVD
jgi:hypothetical protein